MTFRCLVSLITLITSSPVFAVESNIDPSIAYFGDSETATGIGRGMTCINRENMTAYTNASAMHYVVPVKHCNLKEPFGVSGGAGDYCGAARSHFKDVIGNDAIKTVVVNLGENGAPAKLFENMLQQITSTGKKKCVWVMPSTNKVYRNGRTGHNKEARDSISAYMDIAQKYCGKDGIINPAKGVKRYKTVEGTHYTSESGTAIGKKICQALQARTSQTNLLQPPNPSPAIR